MSDRDALLFANEVFYRAFSDGDLNTLNGLWAVQGPVACIHPGWPALTDRESIMNSFQSIIEGPSPPIIECRAAHPMIFDPIGIVLCYEIIDQQTLVATNVFRHEGSIWTMIHHQAGPSQSVPDEDDDEDPHQVN